MAGLMLWSVLLFAAQSDENQAPGRTMAQQATKGKQIWNTIDHTDKVACQSCHIPEFARVNPTKVSWDRALGKGQESVGVPFIFSACRFNQFGTKLNAL